MVGNDWFGSTLLQFIAQFVAVVGLVAEPAFGWLNSIDEAFCDRALVRLTPGQHERDECPLGSECVDLRVAPAARAANSLFLLPSLFRPHAQEPLLE
jgi:hypothetical protein